MHSADISVATAADLKFALDELVRPSFRGVEPANPLNISLGHWGAWQLVARYEQLDVDHRMFSPLPLLSYADPDASARSAYTWSVGLNWWLNQNVRVNASFSHTWFQGGGYINPLDPALPTPPATVTRQDENAIFTRVQLAF